MGRPYDRKIERKLKKHIDLLIERYPDLWDVVDSIIEAYSIIEHCYEMDGKLLVAGNGGSASDAEHITGELMKSFKLPRPVSRELAGKLEAVDPVRGYRLAKDLEKGLMTIPLVDHQALTTAYMNDVGEEGVFAQQLLGYGRRGDVFLGISTSGNSENVMRAAIVAKALDMQIIALTGKTGGKLEGIADVAIKVPATEVYMVQEYHLPVYHCLCLMLEEHFFGQ